MSQRQVAFGTDPITLVNATGNETVTLNAMATGRKMTVRRMDSGTAVVTVAVASGLTLDGVLNGTTTIGADSEKAFVAIDGGFESIGGLSRAELSLTYVQPFGARYVQTGDSIDAGNFGTSSAGGLSHADCWPNHLAIASQGALILVGNKGHGGYTTAQLLALFDSEVLALNPDVVGIGGGTNDSLDGSGYPTDTATNIKAMVAKAKNAGAWVFLRTLPPAAAPALGTPSAPTVTTAGTGGTLTAATYSYRVAAVNGQGSTLASTAGTVVVASGTTNANTIYAAHVEGATAYRLYGRTGGSELLIATNGISGQQSIPSRVFTDTGSATPSGALPGSDTTAAAWAGGGQNKILTINNWIRRYGATAGIPVVDVYGTVVDPAGAGTYAKGYTHDGVHPTPTSHRRIGTAAWTALQSYVTPLPSPLTRDNSDTINLASNGCLVNGTANLPNTWNSSGGAGNYTDTLGTVTGFVGKGFTCTLTAPDTRLHDQGVPLPTSGWSAGDKLLIAARIKMTGCEAGGMVANLKLYGWGTSQIWTDLYLSAADVDGVWATEFTAIADATGPGWRFNLGYGVGSATIGQLTIYNLTTGGVTTLV